MKTTMQIPETKRGEAEVVFYEPADQADGSFVIQWEPGNGTRYNVMFTPISAELCNHLEYSFAGKAVLVINGLTMKSYPFQYGGFLALSYVAEKLFNENPLMPDVSEVCRIIGLNLNREVDLCTDESGHMM